MAYFRKSWHGTTQKEKDEKTILPKFGEFQLVGDSILVRFAGQVLHQQANILNGTSYLGYCVSGQRINQLRRKIKNNEYTLRNQIVMLIGTNDVLCGRSLNMITRHFGKLIRLLRQRSVSKIVILTLPPIPRLALMRNHWEAIRGFNQFLLSLHSPEDKIRVIDIFPLFMKQDLPIFAAPPSIRNKRKLDTLDDWYESPQKILKLSLPEVKCSNEEDDSHMSPFCRYLNRVNKDERNRDAESSDDDGPCHQVRPYIDFEFWKTIQLQMSHLHSKSVIDESSNNDMSLTPTGNKHWNSTSSSPTSPTVLSKSRDSWSSPNNIPSIHKKIMDYTKHFIKLENYETQYSGSQRMDMIHPNSQGLRKLWFFLVQNDVV